MTTTGVPDDTQLKLYGMLVDQLQKYTTIFWQFPTAFLATNAFALDKFSARPIFLLATAIVDFILVFCFHRLITAQLAIIVATKHAETILGDSNYHMFIPKFPTKRMRAPTVVIWTLIVLTSALAIYAAFQICKQ